MNPIDELRKCKHCQSDAVVKFGTYKGTQLYWCKSCQRKFKADNALFHMKVPAEYVSSALNQYYTGMSIGDICKLLKQEHDYLPSKHIVWEWVDKYTSKAADYFRNDKPQVGNTWVADETVLDLDNHKVWFWDIIDADTRYLLASRVSELRTTKDAQKLMEAALERAGKAPKVVLTDKLSAYLDGVEMTFGADTEHRQSRPFTKTDSTNKIERFHNTLKERTKVMRGFRDMDTLIQFSDGFLAYYNYFRPHEALQNRTPAEVAGLDSPVKSWLDLCRVPVSKEQEIKTHRTPKLRIPKVRVAVDRRHSKIHRLPRLSRG